MKWPGADWALVPALVQVQVPAPALVPAPVQELATDRASVQAATQDRAMAQAAARSYCRPPTTRHTLAGPQPPTARSRNLFFA
jgi:hypothetical protein